MFEVYIIRKLSDDIFDPGPHDYTNVLHMSTQHIVHYLKTCETICYIISEIPLSRFVKIEQQLMHQIQEVYQVSPAVL